MATQRLLNRTILTVTVIGLLCPILIGLGCPGPQGLWPLPGDTGGDQVPPDDTPPTDEPSGDLLVSVGPDRIATVGAPIQLCGLVSGGQEPYAASWSPASALTDADTLTPTFVPPNEGEYVFTLTVFDSKGLGGSRSITVNALDHAALGSFKWGANFAGGGYQLIATFTKPVDEATAENVNNYRVSPPDDENPTAPEPIVKPTSAVLGADSQTVTLLFSTGTLARDTRFDISVDDGILGTDGVAVAEVAGLPAVANSADTQIPTVAVRRWAKGTTVNDAESAAEKEIWDDTGIAVEVRYNYILEIVFNETMDSVSATNLLAYRMQEGEDRYTPTIATLANDGRTLTLIFQDGPLSRDSKLDTGLVATLDINGRQLALETGKAITANADDKTAPAIVQDSVRFVEGVTDGGYQITIDFDEPMDRASLEQVAGYQLDGAAPSSAELAADGRQLLLTFAAGTFSTTDQLSIAANSVRDINGVVLPAQTNRVVLPSEDEVVSPGVPTLMWLPGSQSMSYQLWAVFAVAMDETTLEDVNNWRISGTDTHPTSVVLSSQTSGDEVAGRTALITFDIDSVSRLDSLDVSVGGSILDISSNPVEQVTVPIAASDADETAPEIARAAGPTTLPDGTILPADTPFVLWCDWGNSPTLGHQQYEVTIQFNEVLDGASAANVENYIVGGNTPTSAELLGGRFVVLKFASVTTPPTSTTGLEMVAFVRDINGLSNSVSTPVQILPGCDLMHPLVYTVRWVSNPVAYQVAVQFSEAMDRTSTEFLAHWTMQDVNGIEQIPTEAELDLDDPTRLLLTFGAGVFAADAQLSFAGDVRDISGKVLTAADGVWPRSIDADPDDTAPLAIASAMWEIDSVTGYVVLVQFSEPIDGDNQGVYTLDGVASESVTINDGGCTATIAFPNALEQQAFSRLAKLSAGAILDLSGDATATDVRDVTPNPEDLFGPQVMFAGLISDPSTPPYEIMVWFSEVLDVVSAETTSNYQVNGTFIKPDSAVLDPADGQTVILTFEAATLPAELLQIMMLDVSVGNSVLDINGVPAVQTTW